MGAVTRRGISAAPGARSDSRSAASPSACARSPSLRTVWTAAVPSTRSPTCATSTALEVLDATARRVLPDRPGHVPHRRGRAPPTDPRAVWLLRASYRADDRPALRTMIRDRASWVAHARTVHDEPTADDDPDAGDPTEVASLRGSTPRAVWARRSSSTAPSGGRSSRRAVVPAPRSGSTTSPAPRCSPRSSPGGRRAWTSRRRCGTWSRTTR